MPVMPIADLLSPRVVSVRPEETVRVAIARMLEEDIGSVAVCEEERLVGIISIGDLVKHKISEVEAEASGLKAYIATG